MPRAEKVASSIQSKWNKKTFGEALKFARLSGFPQLTQQELGALCGLTAFHISHFECGRRFPHLVNFRAICAALNVSADELLFIA